MGLFARLFATRADPIEQWRPLWHRIVALARGPHWYRDGGVADTLDGRFDMVVTILALAMLRLEDEDAPATARLTELFVDDMSAQLREAGIGDPAVGKRIGKLVSTLGGRMGALRRAGDDAAQWTAFATRNIRFAGHGAPETVADGLRALAARFATTPHDTLAQGELA